ncbi:hypothetical protein L218DRAFT_734340 [Marasmius fiardii PR-910]|nr:hypothetical protein L218DRAFT_734340 [Marasmius fiardii PR-910]
MAYNNPEMGHIFTTSCYPNESGSVSPRSETSVGYDRRESDSLSPPPSWFYTTQSSRPNYVSLFCSLLFAFCSDGLFFSSDRYTQSHEVVLVYFMYMYCIVCCLPPSDLYYSRLNLLFSSIPLHVRWCDVIPYTCFKQLRRIIYLHTDFHRTSIPYTP